MNSNSQTRRGLIVAAHGRRGLLEDDRGRSHPYLVAQRKLCVVCGDRVRWVSGQTSEVTITGVEARENQLSRADAGRRVSECLAANLSLLAVVCAPRPEPDWFVVDRYLCAAADMHAEALIVVNKADTGNPYVTECDNYRRVGYSLLVVSAATGEGLGELARAFDGHVGMLVGQSGVGKSTLVNCLVPGAEVNTAALSGASDEGRHTTTASIMHRLPSGGRLIDSPGVRDFVPAINIEAEVQAGYPEIQAAAADCRFANCRHLREPGCAVKKGIEDGRISPRRYESYKRLLRNVQARN